MDSECEQIATYMIENKTTLREAAKYFNTSKSRVHYLVNEDLKFINNSLYLEVRKLLDDNWKDRNRRGGLARQRKSHKNKILP